MPEVWFYTLGANADPDAVFVRLAEKSWQKFNELFVYCDSREEALRLDELLWSFNSNTFIPHSLMDQDFPPKPLPALLGWPDTPILERAVVINMSRLPYPETTHSKRIIEIVPCDTELRSCKRSLWSLYRKRHWSTRMHELTH